MSLLYISWSTSLQVRVWGLMRQWAPAQLAFPPPYKFLVEGEIMGWIPIGCMCNFTNQKEKVCGLMPWWFVRIASELRCEWGPWFPCFTILHVKQKWKIHIPTLIRTAQARGFVLLLLLDLVGVDFSWPGKVNIMTFNLICMIYLYFWDHWWAVSIIHIKHYFM